ncbi:MAG: hypothetical protein NZO16_01160 [Deltaproteobacteria bacterium]|nr:hypothetical protein [Deltaproteobacteria bacterium]
MENFCDVQLTEEEGKKLKEIQREVREKICEKDITLFFQNWDYQTRASDDFSKLLSDLVDRVEFGFFIAPVSYHSRFKGIIGRILQWSKWLIFNKVLLRFLYPFLDKDYQFKMGVIQALESLRHWKQSQNS